MGEFQGAGSLTVAAGATLVLGGAGVQVAPPAVGRRRWDDRGRARMRDVSLALPSAPALHRLAARRRAARRRHRQRQRPGPAPPRHPTHLGDEIAIAAGATLTIDRRRRNPRPLRRTTSSSGAGCSTARSRTAPAPSSRTARSMSPATTPRVRGDARTRSAQRRAMRTRSRRRLNVTSRGRCGVATKYTPAAGAAQLVLAARPSRRGRSRSRCPAPRHAGLGAAYGATGYVTLGAPG